MADGIVAAKPLNPKQSARAAMRGPKSVFRKSVFWQKNLPQETGRHRNPRRMPALSKAAAATPEWLRRNR
ncbi:MAG: hypothetical protein AB7S80_15940 [Rhizobiaceae bacterium]